MNQHGHALPIHIKLIVYNISFLSITSHFNLVCDTTTKLNMQKLFVATLLPCCLVVEIYPRPCIYFVSYLVKKSRL